MALSQGLIDTYWRKYNQRRALTGLPSSYQEQRGMLDPMMEATANKDIQEAQLRYTHDIQNRQLTLQEQAQKDAARAANISGVANIGALGLGAYSLSKPSIADYLMQKQLADRSLLTQGLNDKLWATGWPAATSAGVPLGSSVPSVTAPSYLTGGVPSVTAGASGLEYGSGAGVGSGGAGILSGAGSGSIIPETGSLAAYDAALAEGAAAGVGSTAGTGTSVLSSVTPYLGPAGAGLAGGMLLGKSLDKILPGGGKTGAAVGGAAGGALAGAATGALTGAWGGPIGAVIGGIVGGAVSFIEDSVICSELLRQGRIFPLDRKKCVLFRFRYIPDDMFCAYLEWAKPHVEAMRKGGWRNTIRLPFAHAFVNYMIAIQDRKLPTFSQRMAWKYAWYKCGKIAQLSEQYAGEVT